MNGDLQLIETLNDLLRSELSAINQYMLHAEMCEDWGYMRLTQDFKNRAINEMRHAERLMERILFLGGRPIVSSLNTVHVGASVPEHIDNDHLLELETCKHYNDAIMLAVEVKDNATKDLLEAILTDEDRHVDELENLQDQISQMGLPIFLSVQMPRE